MSDRREQLRSKGIWFQMSDWAAIFEIPVSISYLPATNKEWECQERPGCEIDGVVRLDKGKERT